MINNYDSRMQLATDVVYGFDMDTLVEFAIAQLNKLYDNRDWQDMYG